MALADLLGRLTGRPPRSEGPPVPRAPGPQDILDALTAVEEMVDGTVSDIVRSRVLRVVRTVRDTVPRLGSLGAGSPQAYDVVATATRYLPEALGGYLRLPRQWADTRPVDRGRTSLMVLCDQLDLLGTTMDQVLDAVYRADAAALVAHGRFLQERFGQEGFAGGPALDAGRPA